MMGCREVVAGQDFNLGDPLFQRVNKFRPLVPKPYTSSTSHNFSNSSSCFNFISLNNNINNYHRDFGTKGEERKEESTHQVMVSSRWNPTPEQLTALEELYRCGTRTPSAEQIQHITAQLRRYGKIEGKNVFYWFQNHKARERQKRRRHLQPPITSTNGTNAHHANDLRDLQEIETIGCKDDKEPGVAKTSFVVEQNFKWTPFISKDSNNPPIILQSEATGPRKAADDMISSECNAATAWIQFHDTITNTNSATTTSTPEFQHNYNSNNYNICTTTKDFMFSSEGNATWPSQVSTTSTNKTITPHQVSLSSNNLITSTNCCSHQDLNHSPKLDYYANDNINSNNNNNNNCCDEENGGEATKSLTLELFPLVKLDRAGENADVILRKMVNMKGNCCVQTREENFNYEFVPYYQFL